MPFDALALGLAGFAGTLAWVDQPTGAGGDVGTVCSAGTEAPQLLARPISSTGRQGDGAFPACAGISAEVAF